MNPEPSTQLPTVHALLHCKSHKLTPLIHNRHLMPRHGWPPLQPIPCNDDVSVMSQNTRRGCLRAKHLTRVSMRHRGVRDQSVKRFRSTARTERHYFFLDLTS